MVHKGSESKDVVPALLFLFSALFSEFLMGPAVIWRVSKVGFIFHSFLP